VLQSFGGFEESSLTEDFSLMFKLREQGKRIVFSPKAEAKDICPPRWQAFSLQRKRWSAGWNEENKKYIASTKDKRKAGLGMINFLLYVNLPIFTFFALIFAPAFWLIGEYLISIASLMTIIFTVSLMVVSVNKYGNRQLGLLAYFPVYIYLSFFMFANATIKPEKTTEWTETPH
jgi:cellulose synthase/poly-beta-1,6-N-acetylglucosamine synthase-like glycosyltransferase